MELDTLFTGCRIPIRPHPSKPPREIPHEQCYHQILFLGQAAAGPRPPQRDYSAIFVAQKKIASHNFDTANEEPPLQLDDIHPALAVGRMVTLSENGIVAFRDFPHIACESIRDQTLARQAVVRSSPQKLPAWSFPHEQTRTSPPPIRSTPSISSL